ncbi:MAG: glycosyltransferase family 2 protein [Actinomycetota bacterium]|nr:glycosyltransferase family 2 protein [Actinomycetota bacterium]
MRTVAVIPAFNCENSVAAAVDSLSADPRISEVIVVDDASQDATAANAAKAGARVVRITPNSGKHVALERGFMEAGAVDVLIMVDADTGTSAKQVLELLSPIEDGVADMVIGVLPSAGKKGGFGFVRDLAAWCIKACSGFEATAPMSGQRALRREVFERCRPMGIGFAVDAALTSDAVNAGFRVIEKPVAMTHDHRGRSIMGFAHRARQGWHIVITFVPRLLRGGRTARER